MAARVYAACGRRGGVFSMRGVYLLCIVEELFCIPEAVLWDCCSFNYSLILKDQRSLPRSTSCMSLERRARVYTVYTVCACDSHTRTHCI